MEIEEVLQLIPGVREVAAVAVSPGNAPGNALGSGPSLLVIYAACTGQYDWSGNDLMLSMQNVIKQELNPLFKIHDLVLVEVHCQEMDHIKSIDDHFAISGMLINRAKPSTHSNQNRQLHNHQQQL